MSNKRCVLLVLAAQLWAGAAAAQAPSLAPPPASASSNTLLGRRNRAAERAFAIAISTEPSWVLSILSK